MALPAYAVVTLAELKGYYPITGNARDAELERAIMRASLDLEAELDRRIVYRAPTETAAAVIYTGAWANGTPVVAAQPNSAGRTMVVMFPSTATAGTLTLTGTVDGVVGATETFDRADGDVQHGLKFFTAATIVTIAGATGSGNVTVAPSQGYIEYHSPRGCEIRPMEWPVQNVIELNEDITRVFGTSTALVAGTTYEIRRRSSVQRAIARVSGGLEFSFPCGYRVVRKRSSDGYRAAAVPAVIKACANELAAWHWQYAEKHDFGLVSRVDNTGSVTRSGPPMMLAGMRERLVGYARPEFDATGERDFDLEAA